MIRYQFRPSLVDHCQTYVLVRPFYSATDQDFNAVHNKLSRYQFAKAEKDNKRILRFKFHKGFPREHMDWGKIQTHRRSIGLIGNFLNNAIYSTTYQKRIVPHLCVCCGGALQSIVPFLIRLQRIASNSSLRHFSILCYKWLLIWRKKLVGTKD